MTELHNHPLVFNQDTTSPSNTTYDCNRCAKVVQGPSYSCGKCRYFYLHKRCADAPLEIQHHPAHRDHRLRLIHYPSLEDPGNCGFCWGELKRFVYNCYRCEFYLHFTCALLPCATDGNFIETCFAAHPHPLVSISPIGNVTCHGCTDPIQDDASFESFACFYCRSPYHKKCLEQPSTTNHPCHRRHQLLLVRNKPDKDFPKVECNLCQSSIRWGFFYRCVPCKFYIHLRCAWPPPIIEDKAHHDHPFTLLLKPNDPFDCNACGNRGNYVSYICSTCNIQVHKDCISLPRHIRLNLHPLPISRCFSICTDHLDSSDWDCKICYKKVNIDHGSYYCSRRYCSRPDCDFVIHVKCSIEKKKVYDVVEVENSDEFEESDLLSDESTSSIIRVIKEIKVGDDVIAAEIEHVSHEHNLIFSDEIKDNKYCNGCVLPILSSFYYCSQCDFSLHKACVELRRMCQLWFSAKPFRLLTDGIFNCTRCGYTSSGFSYNIDGFWKRSCLRCASLPHSFTYQADEPHYIFYVDKYEGKCNACGEIFSFFDAAYRCKDCSFALHLRCVSLPRTAWHKCDQHSLTFAYRDPDDYPLRHYCDICEEERDLQQWFYHCETCDKAMHVKCVLEKYSFINAGSKYTYENHPHPLTFVRKMYYYPECNNCGKPCQDLALECVGHGCQYIVHWNCIKQFYF